MIEVRIRTDRQTTSQRLCDWPSTQLDSLIPLLGRWGGYGPDGEFSADNLSGQICFDSTGAYFELIVGDDA